MANTVQDFGQAAPSPHPEAAMTGLRVRQPTRATKRRQRRRGLNHFDLPPFTLLIASIAVALTTLGAIAVLSVL